MIVSRSEAQRRLGRKLPCVRGRPGRPCFYLLDKKGSRKLGGPYRTRAAAVRREQQIKGIVAMKKRGTFYS